LKGTLLSLWTSFLVAFSVLLPLINPVGPSLVFLGLVGDQPSKVFRSLARRIAINNIVFLAIIELLGAAILTFFGMSLPIVQLAGGIVIAVMGWGVLNERSIGENTKNKGAECGAHNDAQMQHLEEGIFYPFTFPITSGPGTLVGLLTLTAHISNQILVQNILAHVGVFLAVVVITVLCYFCYAYAPKVSRAIPPSTAHGILRVIAFILLCIGVQIAWNGFSALLRVIING
jgi:multiple antibiotic resistance protein